MNSIDERELAARALRLIDEERASRSAARIELPRPISRMALGWQDEDLTLDEVKRAARLAFGDRPGLALYIGVEPDHDPWRFCYGVFRDGHPERWINAQGHAVPAARRAKQIVSRGRTWREARELLFRAVGKVVPS